MEKIILLAISAALVFGCGTREIAVSSALPCPEPLVIAKAEPEVRARIDELRDSADPVDVATYEFFLRRAALQKARRDRLQEICRSTRGE
jgi:hypothetical protein